MSTSERPLKTSELANEENEGVFESNRKSQDEGYSSFNSSTFHTSSGPWAAGTEKSDRNLSFMNTLTKRIKRDKERSRQVISK